MGGSVGGHADLICRLLRVNLVLEARDVTSGYRLFRRNRPDVIIVDLGMQGTGLGGLDLIRRMRSHEPSRCILVFSKHNDPMIAARALPNLRLMTAEHVRPMWDGGRSVAGNVVAACYECNHARSGELNQTKRGSKFTIGDDTPSSPFAGLRVLLQPDSD